MSHFDQDPKIIEHAPNEERRPKWVWKATWMVVFIFWGFQYIDGIKWDSLLVGLLTGMVLVGWVADTFGLGAIASWIRQSHTEPDK